MTPEKAIELATKNDPLIVVLILTLFFLAYLVFYVLKEGRAREKEQNAANEKRDERWALLIEKMELRTDERHNLNQAAMALLAEDGRRQREEHETFALNQKSCIEQHLKICSTLEAISLQIIRLAK